VVFDLLHRRCLAGAGGLQPPRQLSFEAACEALGGGAVEAVDPVDEQAIDVQT
jgi:hypothetical protein